MEPRRLSKTRKARAQVGGVYFTNGASDSGRCFQVLRDLPLIESSQAAVVHARVVTMGLKTRFDIGIVPHLPGLTGQPVRD